MRRAVFLDRDGVINRALVRDGRPYPPSTLEQFEILPGVAEACHQLHQRGLLLVVVTNQPDLARGTQNAAELDRIHTHLQATLPLDAIHVCPHDDADACPCRKPKPGMLLDAARLLNIDLATSFLVGDRWRDVEAGQRAGCRTVFLDYGYAEKRPAAPTHSVTTLFEAAHWILQNLEPEMVEKETSYV